MKIYGVMACDPRGVIGCKGRIPWHCPGDLEHYRKITANQLLIMGYYTYLSMPQHALEKKTHLVFSRTHQQIKKDCPTRFISSWEEFLKLKITQGCMIGGSQIARLFLEKNALQSMILTHIQDEYEGDAYFPLDKIKNWPSKILSKTPHYTIVHYENIRYQDPSH